MRQYAINYIKTLIWLYKETNDSSWLVEARQCLERLISQNRAFNNALCIVQEYASFEEETKLVA